MNFEKKELVSIVEDNRKEHRKIFEQAVKGYRKKVTKELEDHIERIKNGDLVYVSVHYPQPADHTRDYDRLLKMLDMTKDDKIPLSETQFAQYVLDDWDWKRQFLTTNSSYSGLAMARLEEM